MATWVALLRGINVGRHNRLPMGELRPMLESLGYDDVRTHLQSGNALFTATGKAATIEQAISRRVKRETGLGIKVLVRTSKELDAVIAANPFAKRRVPAKELHVAFLSGAPSRAKVAKVDPASYAPDQVEIGKRALYLRLPNGWSGSKLPDVEKLVGLDATVRTLRTVTRLAELAHD
jgi:uncharacterized protein (DUF1697 family)